MYYKINEEAAKRANDANRFCEYQQGSATANYHRMVDKAVEIAEMPVRKSPNKSGY